MQLIIRDTTEADLAGCGGLVPEASHGLRVELTKAWHHFLLRGALISSVVEDPSRAPNHGILAAGMSYVVTPTFLEEVRNSRRPTLGHVLVDSLAKGGCPALDREGIRNANSADGLNLAFHALLRQGIERDDHFGLILDRLTQAFFEAKAGYNIKQAVTEAMGEQELQLHYAIGGRAFDVQPISNPDPPMPFPCFRIWLNKRAALDDPGSQFCRLFLYSPPRFFFGDKEQMLLRQALLGRTDEELASSLGVSLSTVKKRWQLIYSRVTDKAPNLLPETREDSPLNRKRGVEKKQKLLEYVRVHPEELRANREMAR